MQYLALGQEFDWFDRYFSNYLFKNHKWTIQSFRNQDQNI